MRQVITNTYQELRRMAHAFMASERRDHTLQPTALANEACARLLSRDNHKWSDRHHFLASAAQQMRRILLDHARGRNAQKRGGEVLVRGVDLDVMDPTMLSPVDMIALDEALGELAKVDPRQCRVVELRYFAGLSTDEVARVMDVAVRTVRRDWVHARAILARHLGRGGQEPHVHPN